VSYSCARAQGAILLPRGQTARVNLTDTMHIRRYIKENIDAWYDFARDHGFGDEQAPEGSIKLVYGCDKSASWAAAAFTERSYSGSVFFNGGLTGGFGPLAELRGTWSEHRCASAEVNEGPKSATPERFRLRATPSALSDLFPSNCRETVFVRAYTIKRKLAGFKWPLRIEAGAGPRDLDDELPEDPGAPAVIAVFDNEPESSLFLQGRRSPYITVPTTSEDVCTFCVIRYTY
jgi:hypothetical protein